MTWKTIAADSVAPKIIDLAILDLKTQMGTEAAGTPDVEFISAFRDLLEMGLLRLEMDGARYRISAEGGEA